jgi:outer membrane lipoprotein SlyB
MVSVALAAFVIFPFGSNWGMRNTALAQSQPIIYPAKGQSQEQMDKDKYECYTWAKGQTGFDPMQAGLTSQAPPPQGQGGQVVKGAAGGAAVGAVAGGISGNAGKGAAAGAAGGALIGGIAKRRQAGQQAQAQQKQGAALASKQSDYNRAFGACMEGRSYTVK